MSMLDALVRPLIVIAVGLATVSLPAGAGPGVAAGAGPAAGTAYGLHADSMYYGGDPGRLDRQASVNSAVNRWTLLWKNIEPDRDLPPGSAEYRWAAADATFDRTVARGMRNLMIIGTSPPWANGSANNPWVVPQTTAAVNAWAGEVAEFAGDAAAHFAGDGATGLMWEVWNEPNEVYFWQHPTMGTNYRMTSANRSHYAILFKRVQAALLAVDPTAQVALGGITGLGATCCLEGSEYVAGLIDQDGVDPDYVGVHSYVDSSRAPETCVEFQRNFTNTGLVRRVLDQRGRSDVPLWLTEWGWSSATVGESTQAAYIRRGLEMIRDRRMSCGGTAPADHRISVSTLFLDIDTASFSEGLFRQNLSEKPSAAVFRSFAAGVGQGGAA